MLIQAALDAVRDLAGTPGGLVAQVGTPPAATADVLALWPVRVTWPDSARNAPAGLAHTASGAEIALLAVARSGDPERDIAALEAFAAAVHARPLLTTAAGEVQIGLGPVATLGELGTLFLAAGVPWSPFVEAKVRTAR
jgi:hypothetical protein